MLQVYKRTVCQILNALFVAFVIVFITGCSDADNSAGLPESAPVVSQKASADAVQPVEITVYQSPTCGCCKEWVEHLRAEGFTVVTHDMENMDSVKKSAGIPKHLQSCHTALVEGYTIEGHVPAADIKRLLVKRPKIAGLTAPGMPMKSPGMQAPDLPPKDYDVLAFTEDGKAAVFTKY